MLHTTTAILLTLVMQQTPAAVAPVEIGSTSPTDRQPLGLISHCQVFLIDDVKIPAREAGQLVSMETEVAAEVRQGQLLAKIDDRESRLSKLAIELEQQAAVARAGNDIEVRHAEASLEVAAAELDESVEINRRSPGSVSATALRRLKLTRRRAELQIDRSRLDLKVAQMTADVKEAAVASAAESIDRRQIVAPFDGTIIDILRQRGEWVNAGEAVLQIIRLDQLRVEGFLNGTALNPEQISHCPVTVEIERARGEKVRLRGEVTFVSPLVQAGGKYRVRARVQNVARDGHWLLLPGMSASMLIHADQSAGPNLARPTPAVHHPSQTISRRPELTEPSYRR